MSKKVLVADDEKRVRELVRTHLLPLGYEVREAFDGEEAIAQIANDHFDLLICDTLMPKKSGWEVLKEVKSNPKTKNLPVIVLTTRRHEPDMFKGYELGANYYMHKPFTRSQLRQGVELMLEPFQPSA
jgi:DNA-binding response OmpR family regulator